MLCLGANKKEWIVLRDKETKVVIARICLANNDKHELVHIAIDAEMSIEIYREKEKQVNETVGAAV